MQYYGATPAARWAGGYGGYGYGQDYGPALTTTAEQTSSPLAQAQSWWSSQPTTTKVAIGLGAAAVVGLIIYALMPGSPAVATPNKRRRRRYRPNLKRGSKRARKAAKKAVITKIRGKRERAPRGKIITVKGGRRFGHLVPPKSYYKLGAKRPKDYAWPKGYQYPLVFRTSTGKINVARTIKHIKNAKSRFSQNKHLYPMAVRKTIARNINAANKRFHVGGETIKP